MLTTLTNVNNRIYLKYIGWWHQIESYPTGEEGTCRSSMYTSNGNQFQVVDTVINNNSVQHKHYNITATRDGILRKTSEDSEGKVF